MRWAAFLLALTVTMVPSGRAQETPEPSTQRPTVADPVARRPSATGDAPVGADSPSGPPMSHADRAIARVLARMLAMPRFGEEIVVTDRYQEALNAHLQAAARECQVARSDAPPSHEELSRYGANPKPPSADLLTPAKMLFRKVKGLFSSGKSRFFLYSIRPDAAPERVVYGVFDSRVSATVRYSVPGTTWKLVGEYDDRTKAQDALGRLERGHAAIPDRAPQTLWAATGCG